MNITRKKSLGIIELTTHLETVNSLCFILEKTSIKLHLFVHYNIFNELRSQSYAQSFEWTVLQEGESINHFLKTHQSVILSLDILLFNTILFHFRAYKPILNHPCKIYRVHNSNYHFDLLQNISVDYLFPARINKWVFFFKNILIRHDFIHKNNVVNKMEYICFPDEMIERNYKKSFPQKKHKIISNIPIACYNPTKYNNLKSDDESIIICIPGSIDSNRKELDSIPYIISELSKKKKKKITWVFLGKIMKNAQSVTEKLMILQKDNINTEIILFHDRVPQDTFDKWMNGCHLIFSPIRMNTTTMYSKERYGVTKISGSISDIIRYNKKAIIPAFYPISPYLSQHIIPYRSTEEIIDIIIKEQENHTKNILPNPLTADFLSKGLEDSLLRILIET